MLEWVSVNYSGAVFSTETQQASLHELFGPVIAGFYRGNGDIQNLCGFVYTALLYRSQHKNRPEYNRQFLKAVPVFAVPPRLQVWSQYGRGL